MSPMIARAAATQAALDRWKGVPFVWGSSDCGQMITSHLLAMGHLPTMPGGYSSARGAAKALKAIGFTTLAAAMDGNGFERIVPAATIAGDIMQMPGAGVGALAIVVGNGRIFGFHEEVEGAVVMQPVQMLAAWRVPPVTEIMEALAETGS